MMLPFEKTLCMQSVDMNSLHTICWSMVRFRERKYESHYVYYFFLVNGCFDLI